MALVYKGVIIQTSCPNLFKDLGKLRATSPKPPVLEKGATSEATCTIFKALTIFLIITSISAADSNR